MPLTWRAADHRDLGVVTMVVNAAERFDESPEITPRDQLEADFDNPAQDLARDSLLVERNGEPVGFGWCWVPDEPARTHLFAFLWVSVLPDAREEVGDQLAERMTQIGEARLSATSTTAEKLIRVGMMAGRTDERDRWTRLGFSPIRWFTLMSRPLDQPLPDLDALAGVSLRSWVDADEEPTRLVHNVAFADHWGSLARSVHDWRTQTTADSHFRRDLSSVLVSDDDGAIVGYLLAHHYPADAEATGRHEVWVSMLGVMPTHRGRGLASAQLTRLLHQARAAGFESAGLDVDSESPTGANRLYERLGFASVGTSVSYVRPAG